MKLPKMPLKSVKLPIKHDFTKIAYKLESILPKIQEIFTCLWLEGCTYPGLYYSTKTAVYHLAEAQCGCSQGPCQILTSRIEEVTATVGAGIWSVWF